MLLYNVTITIDLDVHDDWLRWMREIHVPEVMATGLFLSSRMCRLLGHEHADAEIYAMQYLVQDMDTLLRYQREFGPALQRQTQERYEGKYAVFRSVMEVVGEDFSLPR
jgi:hypothetical protein